MPRSEISGGGGFAGGLFNISKSITNECLLAKTRK